jgi:hypothetical protein
MGPGEITRHRPLKGGYFDTPDDSGAGTYAEQLSYQDSTTMAEKPPSKAATDGDVRDGGLV